MRRNLHFLLFTLFITAALACNPTGGGSAECGNGIIEGDEECDTDDNGGNTCLLLGYYGGQVVCNDDCTLNIDNCELFGSCGDGVLHDTFEECEPSLAMAETCEGLGYPSGTLSCLDDCRFDVSQCEGADECGDNLINPAFEECEQYDLDFQTCETLGYYGDGLACDDRCRFDLTICQINGRCGDGVAQPQHGEECDGADVQGQSCTELGYYGGGLGCTDGCLYDITNCATAGYCGDGILQSEHETCDGTNLGGATCEGQDGYYPGTPGCSDFCEVAYDECGRCGDGVYQDGFEECDGQDTGTARCRALGYFGGEKSGCNGDCTAIGCGGLIMIDGGQHHTCAVDDAGNAYCWGYNNKGQLGDGTTTESRVPVMIDGLSGVAQISAGREHSCAVKQDGTLWCWGNNSNGQLGTGNTADQTTPVQVTIPGYQAVWVSCGDYHTCAVTSAGNAWCWGDNTSGKLGDGTTNERHTPTQVDLGASNVETISAGSTHTCAVRGGLAYCWGNNYDSQLGEGTTNNSWTPVQVSALSLVNSIAAGNTHSCASLDGGDVYCWGSGSNGKLGDGYTLNRETPVQVQNLTGALSVSVGSQHSCAVLSNGTVWCWGDGGNGRLGNDSTSDSDTPVQASGLLTATWMGTGDMHTCAVTDDGMGYCWGFNFHSQLGDDSAAQRQVPTLVAQPAP